MARSAEPSGSCSKESLRIPRRFAKPHHRAWRFSDIPDGASAFDSARHLHLSAFAHEKPNTSARYLPGISHPPKTSFHPFFSSTKSHRVMVPLFGFLCAKAVHRTMVGTAIRKRPGVFRRPDTANAVRSATVHRTPKPANTLGAVRPGRAPIPRNGPVCGQALPRRPLPTSGEPKGPHRPGRLTPATEQDFESVSADRGTGLVVPVPRRRRALETRRARRCRVRQGSA